MTTKDTIFSEHISAPFDFVFDESVVNVFPDMIKRSVPGYSTIIHMIGQLAERYAQDHSYCYDLGCSLGAATLSMRHRVRTTNTKIIAIDNSQDMLNRCQQVINADNSEIPVELRLGSILDNNINISDASICVLNFTLQFIPVNKRKFLLNKIFQGMKPGGLLILSEKIAFADNELSKLMIDLHHYFKKTNGYTDLEISQKRNAIENILVPETLSMHKQRLEQIGFQKVELWFQCFNFGSLIAFKPF